MAINFPGFPHEVFLNNLPDPFDHSLKLRQRWAKNEYGQAAKFHIERIDTVDFRITGSLLCDGPWLNLGSTFMFKDEKQAAMFRMFWG